ncbi:MAG: erythromycin biosynthesis sensory transduction protein eryC1 [Acidobacteria bacterium]|nr:MAG: erythromycin biosynthesis sensory transduction protein eryC1 [Acidobacteriota bacterium]PYU44420.1 MAG: erythromycin biosynthesis sensory transduction protein eryC1 [Acidobacteriota bacterium]PYU70466.1 MAG: erythromycin biosynthesis sensory transduction protein eryC1 [Acidobacteriota bacterium]
MSMPANQTPQVPFVDLAAQYSTIADEINETTSRIIQKADFILGREVRLFEEEFAAFSEARYAVGVDSGTSALELALRAYDIGPGDEVITAANSFIASALAISHAGATPVLVDVDPFTHTIDVTGIERAITSRTKAILPVHLYGHPAHMDPIRQLAEQHGLIVIEDACQAHGARYKGRRAGSLGHAAAFSFYPGKNLGAYGDGGMVVTNDADIRKRLEMLRNYGQEEKYHHLTQGFNRRLDTLQAAVLRVKLKYLEKWNAARRWQAELYHRLLAGTALVLPSEAVGAQSVWHLYVIRTEHRDKLKEYLASRGIAAGIHYPVPIHLQPAYKNLGYKRGSFPVTEQYAQRILSLPMYAELTPELIEYVSKTILTFLSANQDSHAFYEQLVRHATPSSL